MKKHAPARSPLPNVNARIEVMIEALDDEGRGRAQVGGDGPEGYDVAVRGAFPGETVHAVVERLWGKRRLLQARLVTFDEDNSVQPEGPCRTPRACPHRAPCPGCPFEGSLVSVQAGFKRARLELALAEAGVSAALLDMLPPARQYGQRQKTKLVVGGRSGRLRLGLYGPHSHSLVAADRCPYLADGLVAALEAVRVELEQANAADHRSGGHLIAVVARTFQEGVAVVIVSNAELDPKLWASLSALVDQGQLASVSSRVDSRGTNSIVGGDRTQSYGPTALIPFEGGPAVDVDAFCQPSASLAKGMYERVAALLISGDAEQSLLEVLGDNEDSDTSSSDARPDDEASSKTGPESANRKKIDDAGQLSFPGLAAATTTATPPTPVAKPPRGRFLDAYAGTGGFARHLLLAGAEQVVAIERSPECLATLEAIDVDGRRIFAHAASVLDALEHLKGPFDGIVCDPPRRGLADDVDAVCALGAPLLVLVSCEPDSLTRDLIALEERGYEVVQVLGVDLFSGTASVEAIAVCRRHDA